MTEKQWANTTSVARVLSGVKASDRKWRLLCCAYARELWPHLYDRGMAQVVQDAEDVADGVHPRTALAAAQMRLSRRCSELYSRMRYRGYTSLSISLLYQVGLHLVRPFLSKTASVRVASYVNRHISDIDSLKGWSAVGASLARCVTGNPFQPVSWSQHWVTPEVESIAAEVYQERRWEELPVLADALEDAGCQESSLLEHLRRRGPHCRGCHVLDLLLGKA